KDEAPLELSQEGRRASLSIRGTEGLLLRFAVCCKPIPGDPIVGVMDTGSGMLIHAEQCSRIQRRIKEGNQPIHLNWAKDITDEFSVELRVELERQRGVIAELASAVTLADGNIERISVEEQNARLSVIHLILHVQGRKHLAR